MGRTWLFALALAVRLLPGEGLAGAAHPGTPAVPEIRYTVCLGNLRPAGLVTYRVRPAGETVVTLTLSDRGRGEALTSHLQLDGAGIPLSEHLTGVDYWKNPIDERFTLAHGKAAWSSGPEKGEKAVAGSAFYVTGAGSLLEIGLLATALLESHDHRLPLLPDGEARIEPAGAARVVVGKQARNLTLYALSGLAVSPLYVWMDPSGTFFGRYDGFVTVVRQGWEEAAPALIKEQTAVVALRAKGAAARLGRRPPAGLAVRGARLFDPATGTVTDGVTVVVAGNRIRAVGRDGEVAVPAGAEVVEAHGRMLLPGLWDMHQHLSDGDGLLDLAAGVTTGRDLANDIDYLLDLKHKWDTGEALGPRVVLAGVIDGPGPYASPTKVLVDSAEQARAAVDRYAALGYVQIKIYSSVDPKLVPAIIAEAHRLGLRVSGHIPNGMTAAEAVRAGYDEIQHVNFLFLNFMPGVDTRTAERMTAIAEHAAELDLASPAVQDFLRLLKERKTVIDPTVTVYEDLLTGRPDRVRPSLAAVEPRLPYQMRRTLLGGNLPVPPGKEQRYLDSYHALLAMVRLLHDAGIPLVAGTDSIAGATLHRELENYVALGIPAPEVLRIATLGAARVMKLDGDLGTIAPGKLADLILVDGDPPRKISDIRRVVLTVKDGTVYDPAELYRTLGVKPAV